MAEPRGCPTPGACSCGALAEQENLITAQRIALALLTTRIHDLERVLADRDELRAFLSTPEPSA